MSKRKMFFLREENVLVQSFMTPVNAPDLAFIHNPKPRAFFILYTQEPSCPTQEIVT